jgi:hypothetical protein
MPKSGSHLFYLESNDGSELFVENMQKPIISNDGVVIYHHPLKLLILTLFLAL